MSAYPVIYAPIKSVKHIAKIQNIPTHKVVDFDTKTTVSDWLYGSATDWLRRLPDLSEYDQVVSDNLVEILELRPDAWLSGSFFWHDVLVDIPNNIALRADKLLRKTYPKMISSSLFSSNKLKEYTRLYEVGLYKSTLNKNLDHNKKNDILISIGHGSSLHKKVQNFINNLSKRREVLFKNVWVEPSLIPNSHPYWMRAATYTPEMYNTLICAVIRPGVGTITDVLMSGGRLFLFHEQKNQEMKHNAKSIGQLGLGLSCANIENAWYEAECYIYNKTIQDKHVELVNNLNFNGVKEAANILMSCK